MLETSKAVAIILVFAILVQFLVDRVKDIVGEKVMGYVKAPVWAALLGVLFAFLFRLDVFAMFGYTAQLPAVAYIMTGLMGWIGGKRILRKAILERFPTDKVERYIEVFGGAAWVLFAKEKQAGQLEVYNDINGDLVNLFRCVKYHCGELQREFDWQLSSREQFFDYVAQANMRGLTDIQRAARFFYVVKLSFGSDRRTYATSKKMVDNAAEYLAKVNERLRGVNIEHKDYADIIRVYDRKAALFYLDPPYIGTEGYYDSPFTPDDHQRLRVSLGPLKGRFILSYNDCPQVRELYKGYTIERVERKENLSGSGENKKQYAEVIIRNF